MKAYQASMTITKVFVSFMNCQTAVKESGTAKTKFLGAKPKWFLPGLSEFLISKMDRITLPLT